MPTPNPLFLREAELDRALELLVAVGHRMVADAQGPCAQGGIDEVDHRTLFLVERRPGITLAELCAATGMSKQTLSRHLRRLIDAGLVEQGTAASDRRRRPLRPTAQAAELLAQISAVQKRRLRLAFKIAGAPAVEGFGRVLGELVLEPRRDQARRPGLAARLR
jgi:DNA-binding MarR family transcriptional regulator